MTIGNRWLRVAVSVLAAFLTAAVALFILGILLPVVVIEMLYGHWDRTGISAGFIVGALLMLCVVPALALASWLSVVIFDRLNPSDLAPTPYAGPSN